jgi:hypothetical protein
MSEHHLIVKNLQLVYSKPNLFQRLFFPKKLTQALVNYVDGDDKTLFIVYKTFCNHVWFFHRWLFPELNRFFQQPTTQACVQLNANNFLSPQSFDAIINHNVDNASEIIVENSELAPFIALSLWPKWSSLLINYHKTHGELYKPLASLLKSIDSSAETVEDYTWLLDTPREKIRTLSLYLENTKTKHTLPHLKIIAEHAETREIGRLLDGLYDIGLLQAFSSEQMLSFNEVLPCIVKPGSIREAIENMKPYSIRHAIFDQRELLEFQRYVSADLATVFSGKYKIQFMHGLERKDYYTQSLCNAYLLLEKLPLYYGMLPETHHAIPKFIDPHLVIDLAITLDKHSALNDDTYKVILNFAVCKHETYPRDINYIINSLISNELFPDAEAQSIFLYLANLNELPSIVSLLWVSEGKSNTKKYLRPLLQLLLDSRTDEHKLKTLQIAVMYFITTDRKTWQRPIDQTPLWMETLFSAILSGANDKIVALRSMYTFLNNQNIYDQECEEHRLLDRLLPYISLFQDSNSLKFLNCCLQQGVTFINSWITKLETDPTITANPTDTIHWLLSHLRVFMHAVLNPECAAEINQLDDSPYIMERPRRIIFSDDRIADYSFTLETLIEEHSPLVKKVLLKTQKIFNDETLADFLFTALSANNQEASITLLFLLAQHSTTINLSERRLPNEGIACLMRILQNDLCPIGLSFDLGSFEYDSVPDFSPNQIASLCKKPFLEVGILACLLLRRNNETTLFGKLALDLTSMIFSFVLPQNNFLTKSSTTTIPPGITMFKKATKVVDEIDATNGATNCAM